MAALYKTEHNAAEAKEVRLTNFQWLQKSERKRATNDTFFLNKNYFIQSSSLLKATKLAQLL